MFFQIPEKIKYVLGVLEQNGFEAYIVGGCVRDLILGITPQDFDITTNALPHQTKALFEKTADIGIHHGTVAVIIDSEPIEVTTYRVEGDYTDARHPNEVKFVSDLSGDLARRDFTVNALCYNEKEGIIDIFGGIEDIKTRTLRTVGDPEKRFEEDALRIMRLFRFSSTLNFKIEKTAKEKAVLLSKNLTKISIERIQAELIKTIMGNNLKSFAELVNSGAFEYLGIEKNININQITNLPKKADLRLFTFLKETSSDLSKTLSLLKLSNNTVKYLNTLNEFTLCDKKEEIKKQLKHSAPEFYNDYLIYKSEYENCDVSKSQKVLKEIIERKEPYLVSHLDISGADIKKLGFSGKEISEILNNLLSAVIVNPDLNKKGLLLDLISNK